MAVPFFLLFQVMDRIEARIKGIKGKSYTPGPPDKAGQQYRQWVEGLYKESIAEGDRFLVTYSEQLREYHVALTINASTTMKNALGRLQRYFDSLNEEKFLPIDEQLKKLFEKARQMLEKYVKEHGETENPLLMKLKELLLKNYEDVKPQQEKGRDGEASKEKDAGVNEDGQQKNGVEEKDVENGNDAVIPDENESCGNENGNESNEESAECTKNDQASVDGDVVYNGDAGETAGGTDEVKKSKAEANDEHNKAEDQNEENNSHSAETAHEDKPSDDRNGDKKEWKGPKGILFTRTRESTEALLDWIKETTELNAILRPATLVGSGDGNSKKENNFYSFLMRK